MPESPASPWFHGSKVWIVCAIAMITAAVTFAAQEFLWDYAVAETAHDQLLAIERNAWLIEMRLRGRANDMFFLKTVAEDELARNPTGLTVSENLRSAIKTMMLARSQYDKIFLLDLDGREILRFDWKGGDHPLEEIPASAYQDEGDRPYFAQAAAAPANAATFTPMELTKEHGVIVRPIRPVVRTIGKIVGPDGKARAMLCLDYQGEQLVRGMRQLEGAPRQNLLLDSHGFWLVGPDPAAETAFSDPARADEALARSDPVFWQSITARKSGWIDVGGALNCFGNIDPVGPVNDSTPLRMPIVGGQLLRWTLLTRIPNALVWKNVAAIRTGIWVAGGLIEVVLIPLVWFGLLSRERRKAAESRLRNKERVLRASEERFRLIVDNVKDYALVMLDAQGLVVSWNTGAQRIKGYQEAEIIGRHFSCFHSPEDVAAGHPDEELRRATAEGRYEEEGWRYRKDGSRFWSKVTITSIFDDSGALRGFAKVAQDVTQRKRSEQQIIELNKDLEAKVEARTRQLSDNERESEERFHIMADSISQLAWSARSDGYITWYNRRWYEYTGTTPEQMEGWGWQAVHDAKTLPLVMEAWSRSIATGQPFEMEFPLRCADGTFRMFLTRVSPLKDAENRVVQWFGTNTDIDELKRAEDKIRLSNEDLERRVRERTAELHQKNIELQCAARAKDSFLANMSHELRTPLNGIIGFSELLVDGLPGPVNQEQRTYLEDVLHSGHHLLQLINDVLDLAKVGAGKMEFHPATFLLPQAIDQVRSLTLPLVQKKNLRLTIAVAADLPPVTLDAQKLKQVVFNLLSNAIKFTDDGGRVGITVAAHDRTHFSIAVSDSGIGIRPENIKRLFKEFEQLDEGTARHYQGTGLGLALTRRIIELQAGNIAIESEFGKGSTFTVILPFVQGAAA